MAPTRRLPRAYPSPDLLQHTIRVWESRLGRTLTEEDARQILENVVGLFRVLEGWDRQQKAEQDVIAADSTE